MTPESAVDLFRSGMYMVVMMVTFLVLPGLIVGLLIAMFQAATQINEMSLSFIPKLMITLAVVIFGAPWIFKILGEYTVNIFKNIPYIVG